jgi:ubiquinone biosynthesis protein UbiJ
MVALPPGALLALQNLINQALSFDPATRRRLAALDGRCFAIKVTAPQLDMAATFNSQGTLTLGETIPEDAEATLSGNAISLAILAVTNDLDALTNEEITLSGNDDLLIELRGILQDLDIDWEAALALVVGDSAAYIMGSSLRQFYYWQRETASRSLSGIGTYLREESGLVVGNKEANRWFQDVRQLSARYDRLAARAERLQRKLAERVSG